MTMVHDSAPCPRVRVLFALCDISQHGMRLGAAFNLAKAGDRPTYCCPPAVGG